MGFRTHTVDFALQYTLQPSLKNMHELKVASEVLELHVRTAQPSSKPFLHLYFYFADEDTA